MVFKPWERWVAVVAFLLSILLVGACAPRTLRLAEQINHFDAEYIPTEGDSMAPALADLEHRLTVWGVTIGDLPPTVGGVGLANLRERWILIRPGLSVNARFEVLAHEAGHLLQPPSLRDEAVAQLFAELVGVGVQRHYKSQTAEEVAAHYLAQMKWTFPAYRYLKRDIDYAVKALTGQIQLPAFREAK